MHESGLKILSIGNSFSRDTMEHVPNIAAALGVHDFKFANLYIGGCSLKQHHYNITNNVSGYEYDTNTGAGWEKTPEYSIEAAIKEEDWDIISIQHGTKDGSLYTDPDSYRELLPLIEKVRAIAGNRPKIAFNMAWVPEPESGRKEITSYGGDQVLMYEKLAELTKNLIAAQDAVYGVSPAGTAIQNARTCYKGKLTRDNFHLTYGLGRYIAGLTFIKALCGFDLAPVCWCPEGVTQEEMAMAKKAANEAVKDPFCISQL